jgi:hypothetical protein
MSPFHGTNGFRREHGDSFFERLAWHTASGIVAALLVFAIQWFLQANSATAANLTSRVTNLEIQGARTEVTLVGIHEELQRLNGNIERLRTK